MKQNKNLKIAITGGIGSGKTAVANIIKSLGYPVLSCDEVYARLLNEGEFVKEIVKEFGEVRDADGNLDRKKLSAIVFFDENKLARLNQITHPKIFEKMFKEAQYVDGKCFFEVPLLFEEKNEEKFDQVIVVLRNLNARIASVSKRDNLSDDEVKKRILNQLDYDNNNFTKYYVIHNDSNLSELNEKTVNILTVI